MPSRARRLIENRSKCVEIDRFRTQRVNAKPFSVPSDPVGPPEGCRFLSLSVARWVSRVAKREIVSQNVVQMGFISRPNPGKQALFGFVRFKAPPLDGGWTGPPHSWTNFAGLLLKRRDFTVEKDRKSDRNTHLSPQYGTERRQ